MGRNLIVIPTYNERQNIEKLIPQILENYPEVDILIVDDNSPDKTFEIADDFAKRDERVHLLLRKEKQGLGKAILAGFKYAVDNGYEKVIRMDADFSHPPRYIKEILSQIEPNCVVICSRYVKGGRSKNPSLYKRFLSRCANFSAKTLLGLKLKDVTSGYRGFPKRFLEEVLREDPKSSGYLFEVEIIYLAQKLGYQIKEIPFTYEGRFKGRSKLGIGETLRSGIALLKLAITSHR